MDSNGEGEHALIYLSQLCWNPFNVSCELQAPIDNEAVVFAAEIVGALRSDQEIEIIRESKTNLAEVKVSVAERASKYQDLIRGGS